MNNLFTRLAGLGLAATFLLTSCEKDEDKVTLRVSASPQLTASATTANITPATATQPAVTYSWTAADFGYSAAVTYTLQFAKKGTNFATVQEYNVGAELSKSFTVGELNTLYNGLDCNIGAVVSTPLDVRVKASVGNAVDPVYSSLAGITASPYQAQSAPADRWAVIGSATPGGWDNETPMTYDFCNRTWSIRLPLTANEFKFRANNTWTVNLGDEGSGDATTTGRKLVYNVAPTPNPPNIRVTAAGTYTIILDVNAKPNPVYRIMP